MARIGVWAVLLLAGLLALGGSPASAASSSAPLASAGPQARPIEDETIYFLMVDRFWNGDPANDRGGARGDRMATGFDPEDPRFFQGGDLEGVRRQLPYIRRLGATAVWLSPVFRNQWVQGSGARASAGYHGYWILDFTDVDPHFGDRAALKRLVAAAHALGMKVYLDIVVNHTADVIRYRECPGGRPCPYRSKAEFPYQRRGGLGGSPINPGFLGDEPDRRTPDNFARLVDPSYAYTPYTPAGREHAKTPDWLNDIRLYHNRGTMDATPEGLLDGDFGGLDDLMTENPRVLAGFIDVYRSWIRDFGVDGYRIDTARHVDPLFWRGFVPAILAEAAADGEPNFALFGEVYDPDPAALARHTRLDGLPAVLDFGFQEGALAGLTGAGFTKLARILAADPDYASGAPARLPIFLDNHDMGRIGWLISSRMRGVSRAELEARVVLAHALLMFTRGVPVIYYGDEQGLVGTGPDSGARETLFPSPAAPYAAETPLGRTAAGAPGLREDGAVFRAVQEMTALRASHAPLRRGSEQVLHADDAGVLVWTRRAPDDEVLVAVNAGTVPASTDVAVDAEVRDVASLHGSCPARPQAPGALRIQIQPLGYLVCALRR